MKPYHYLIALFALPILAFVGLLLWYAIPYIPLIAQVAALLLLLAAGGWGYHWWEDKKIDRAIKRETLYAAKQTRVLVQSASERGFNVKVTPDVVEVINPVSLLSPKTVEGSVSVAPPTPLALPAPQHLYPHAPVFAAMRSLIQPGRLVLGYTVDGPVYGDVTDLLSMAFVGKPGTGKSSALLYYLAMLLMVKADVYVFDPQGSLNEVADFIPYYGEFRTMYHPLAGIYQEIAEREDIYRRTKQIRNPLLVLVDELPAIARYEQKNDIDGLLALSEKIVLENRKHNCFCLLTGQSLPAGVLPTITRDNLSSRLVFNSSDAHARMAGLDNESRKMLLPLLRKARPGTAILDVTRRPQPEVAAVPLTTVDDLRAIVDGNTGNGWETPAQQWETGSLREETIVESAGNAFAGAGNAVSTESVSMETRETIKRMRKRGLSHREIAPLVGLSGRKYKLYQAVCEEEDIDTSQDEEGQ